MIYICWKLYRHEVGGPILCQLINVSLALLACQLTQQVQHTRKMTTGAGLDGAASSLQADLIIIVMFLQTLFLVFFVDRRHLASKLALAS